MKRKSEKMDDYYKAKEISDAIVAIAVKDNKEKDPAVEAWIHENCHSNNVLCELSDKNRVEYLYKECDEIENHLSEDCEKFSSKLLQLKNQKKLRRIFVLKVSSTAAAVVLISFLFLSRIDTNNLSTEKYESDAKPLLILSDGKSVNLSDLNESVEIEETVKIKKNKDILSYTESKVNQSVIGESQKYNTIVIPSMYNYTIILEDSTEVILNANTELKYPTKFSGETREVFLKGEAFFSVKKGNKPFIVNSEDVKIKVYGTKFNVNASNHKTVETVLISGSVGVSFEGADKEVMLKPNQKSVVDLQSKINTVVRVEIERYIAWTAGYFRYDSDKLADILAEISDWYDVKFIYDESLLGDFQITASFEKATLLENLLLSIEDVSNVKFIKEGGCYRVVYKK